METIYVGVGEFACSKTPNQVIKTMALGSCVGVVVLVPATRAMGLLHVALPESSINKEKSLEKPGMFADTGIPKLLQVMKNKGFVNGQVLIKLMGGASIMDPNNTFNIGKRNVLAVRKVLWQYKLGAIAEDIGDSISRTVTIEVNTGKVYISSPGRGTWEL